MERRAANERTNSSCRKRSLRNSPAVSSEGFRRLKGCNGFGPNLTSPSTRAATAGTGQDGSLPDPVGTIGSPEVAASEGILGLLDGELGDINLLNGVASQGGVKLGKQ